VRKRQRAEETRGVALQVAFERQILKTVFLLDRFQVMGFERP
jgi:hypothetical protein